MKLTLITATYNSAATLPQCLASVAVQTYGELEHLIVDGLSTDTSLQVAEQYRAENQGVRIISEPDHGIYDALNKGLKHASGDVIGFLHSDDMLDGESTLSDVMEYFRDPEVIGVYADLVYVHADKTQKVRRYWKSRPFRPGLLARGWMPAHPTLYLRKTVYDQLGGFDTSFSIAADYDFMLRVLKQPDFKWAYHPKVAVRMRLGGASNKSLKSILNKSREDLRAMRKNQIRFPYLALLLKNGSKIPQFFNSPKVNAQ